MLAQRRLPATLLAPPPTDLAEASLFFDFDGTLVDLAPTPDAVVVEPALVSRLDRLVARLPGRVAIVTGRSIAQIDALMGKDARRFTLAASHGAEQRLAGEPAPAHERPAALADVDRRFAAHADRHGLVAEPKSLGSALHFRVRPEAEADAVILAERLAAEHDLVVQHGKMMVEVRTPGDKGAAIASLMTLPAMAGTRPLFFGDDVTDEDGFAAAAELGGAGVLIGGPRATAARYGLGSVAALAGWIEEALAQ